MDFSELSKDKIIEALSLEGEELQSLYDYASKVKLAAVGNKVYYRGLIEYSNRCAKNCFYCGVRQGNKNVDRYTLQDVEVIEAARLAHKKGFGSLVLQSGERSDTVFTEKIAFLLREIRKATKGELHVTLSMGEQSEQTYRLWRESGAHRYLLRIEASNPALYKRLHPNNALHSFEKRTEALELLRKTSYQVGTGVMIGLPFQTLEDLADDLLFIKKMDVDMVGMGPYIEHEATPLFQFRDQLLSKEMRFELSMKMVALLRIMMPDINMAATTAMQTLHPEGREKALKIGANVIMPNLTPLKYREGYLLYENKPNIHEETDVSLEKLRQSIGKAGCVLALGEWGDSKHFRERG
ncbi:MAG: [FeFe] hydrogenase H-cluster radical SAM maturase HydE [Bacteroidales bacterium]|nr:[FeFe] hydrogenase H-cluster radical SAM maturase HydE [Bacteroidales bacterium]